MNLPAVASLSFTLARRGSPVASTVGRMSSVSSGKPLSIATALRKIGWLDSLAASRMTPGSQCNCTGSFGASPISMLHQPAGSPCNSTAGEKACFNTYGGVASVSSTALSTAGSGRPLEIEELNGLELGAASKPGAPGLLAGELSNDFPE